MRTLKIMALAWGLASAWGATPPAVADVSAEWNPIGLHVPAIGSRADRVIVGFKATPLNALSSGVKQQWRARRVQVVQAQTTALDATALLRRVGLAAASSRQLTPSMHLIVLRSPLYGAAADRLLSQLRADSAVAFAEIDGRRYAHTVPNDPLFQPVAASSSGQWYMLTPSGGSGDLAATDAVSAWTVTGGSSGTVIADVDSGVRFDHADLLRAGYGGRLLPGYDFVGQDYDGADGAALGTYLTANDGDGWDPDPSDPGDWINAADQTNAELFPSSRCPVADSSWHGTRVSGLLGAITNNNTGIAGMTWAPYLLPVRALGKCGGYDSDIIAAMQWAVGLPVSGVPDNPYPAAIVNLSLGGSGSCPAGYQSVVNTLTGMGVLVVASAGNSSGPVDSPANCSGVLAVAGLRNVGTKVGYSSFGAEVGIAAPAGNCVNSSGACLRSIDTTVNTGLTTPANNTYTDQINPNLGTSFAAPIVAGVAALMRARNVNLTPAQLILRMQRSAAPFPPAGTVPVCTSANGGTECSCGPDQCGAGMIDASSAVADAARPIAAVALPSTSAAGTAYSFDASGSAAACGQSIATYAWTATGSVTIVAGAAAAAVQASWGGGSGTLSVTVTDSAGNSDTAVVDFGGSGIFSNAPAQAADTASCPAEFAFTAAAPTLTPRFTPASVANGSNATLSFTLGNSNAFALTQASFTQPMPSNLGIVPALAPTTTCTGAAMMLTFTASAVTLNGANVPAHGSCAVTVTVRSTSSGAYTSTVAPDTLQTGPAGGNAAAASASLEVTAPGSSGGGGKLDWTDALFVIGVLLAGRGQLRARLRRPPRN